MTHIRKRLSLHRGDEGLTLVELMVAMLLTTILTTVSLLIFNTYTKVDEDNKASYNELNQLIPVGTSFQRLLRTAVAPATGGTPTTTAPVPPFGHYRTLLLSNKYTISTTKLTFYSNTGTRFGPVRVTAALTATKEQFKVTVTKPVPTSCPSVHTQPANGICTWTNLTRTRPVTLFTVSDVYNSKLPTPSNPTRTKAIFKYYLKTPYTKTPTNPASPTLFKTCTKPIQQATPSTPIRTVTVTRCAAANINSVKVDLEVKAGTTNVGRLESQTVTYQLSSTSQNYSPEVG